MSIIRSMIKTNTNVFYNLEIDKLRCKALRIFFIQVGSGIVLFDQKIVASIISKYFIS